MQAGSVAASVDPSQSPLIPTSVAPWSCSPVRSVLHTKGAADLRTENLAELA